MLIITILPDNTRRSLFRWNNGPGRIIDELPEKISQRITKSLNRLKEDGVKEVSCDGDYVKLINNRGQCDRYFIDMAPSFWPMFKDFMKETIEVTSLLHWFLGRHNYSNDEARLGGEIFCSDCHAVQPQGVKITDRCYSEICPSHKKWVEVLGDLIPPNDLVKKAFMGLPRNGDANSWAMKG